MPPHLNKYIWQCRIYILVSLVFWIGSISLLVFVRDGTFNPWFLILFIPFVLATTVNLGISVLYLKDLYDDVAYSKLSEEEKDALSQKLE